MKIRHALAGLLAALAMAAAAPAAVAATPATARPANIYNEAVPANFYADAAPVNFYADATPALKAPITLTRTIAATASASAATCPAPGHRIKVSSSATVYLVGPGDVLYFFTDSSEYFGLYSSFNGITTVSDSVLDACWARSNSYAYELPGLLIKTSSNPKVYIADPAYAGGWRWITSQSVFNTYGFDSSKILTGTFSPIAANWS
jgi:hypothetical protein